MFRILHRRRPVLRRSGCFAGAFVVSSLLLMGLGAAFDGASREPFLRDTPQARLAVAHCDALGERTARHGCVRRLVAEARARDRSRGEARFAALAAAPGSAPH